MTQMFKFRLVFAALVTLSPLAARAQQFLYTPLPPKGSAYVRFVNGLDAAADVKPGFLVEQQLGAATTDRVTAYGVAQNVAGKALTLTVTAGPRHGQASLTAAPGTFVTVILRPDGASGIAAVPVVDETDFNQTRAHLAFYNATSDCVSAVLKLLPANVSVFADVAPGTAKGRSVNPVTATVVPSCATGAAPPVALQGLQVGAMYSIWVMHPAPQQMISFISRDTTLAWKP